MNKNVKSPKKPFSVQTLLRRSNARLFSSIAIIVVAFIAQTQAQDSTLSPKSKTATIKLYDEEPTSLNQIGYEIYPTEIYWGDPVYILSFSINTLEDGVLVKQSVRKPMDDYFRRRITIMSDFSRRSSVVEKNLDQESVQKYTNFNIEVVHGNPVFKNARTRYSDSPSIKLALGEKILANVQYYEIPSLTVKLDRFWNDVNSRLDSNGAALNLDYGYGNVGIYAPLQIKPRPNKDQEAIALLTANRDDNRTFDSIPFETNDLPNVQMIEIAGKQYHPAWFVRPGKNLLNESNVPTSLEGWRALEASLSPSALRDEVQFIRMKIEVYAQQDDVESRNKIDALFNWLWTLPAAQRVAMFRAVPICPEYETYPPPPRYVDLQREFYAVDDPKALAPPISKEKSPQPTVASNDVP